MTTDAERLEYEREVRMESNFLTIGYVRSAHGRWVPPEDLHSCDNCGAFVTDAEYEQFHVFGPCPNEFIGGTA